jgi:hypothetical protein
MKYAILIYDDPVAFGKLDEAALGQMYAEYDTFGRALADRDQMRGGEQLSMTSVTTLRSENGKTIVADGPFAETKEQLAGFFLIECGSLDEALDAAGQVPSLRYGGTVEVRPVTEAMEQH